MSQMMGVINLIHEGEELQDLTMFRSSSSVPFGGRYRFIDFMLSSMVNSDIANVAILANKKYTSLMDHIKNGKAWDLSRKRDGLFLLPPADYDNFPGLDGDIKNFYWHLDYFYRCSQEYVVISGSHILINIDYRDVLEYHINQNADITVVYTGADNFRSDVCHKYTKIVDSNEQGYITGVESRECLPDDNISLDMYIMKRSLFIELVETSMIRGSKYFTDDAVIKNISQYCVAGYKHVGHIAPMYSINDYYRHSMELLDSNVREQFFHSPGTIYTKVKDEPPSKYTHDADVRNSMIANGCHIQGKIENSILFRGVKVHPGAIIKNSIIMQRCEIGKNAVLENVILDKEVYIAEGSSLAGKHGEPKVVAKKMVI